MLSRDMVAGPFRVGHAWKEAVVHDPDHNATTENYWAIALSPDMAIDIVNALNDTANRVRESRETTDGDTRLSFLLYTLGVTVAPTTIALWNHDERAQAAIWVASEIFQDSSPVMPPGVFLKPVFLEGR